MAVLVAILLVLAVVAAVVSALGRLPLGWAVACLSAAFLAPALAAAF